MPCCLFSQNTRIEILRTLVDCLETEGDTACGDAGQELDESDVVMEERVSRSFGCAPSLRVSVLKILLASLDNPWPNLGHFLLGFRIDRQVSALLGKLSRVRKNSPFHRCEEPSCRSPA